MDSSFNPFADGEILKAAPLTPEQEEIWLSIEIGGAEASLAYNEAVEVSLIGQLNVARREFGALRTRYAGACARARALWNVEVPLRTVFGRPTPGGIAGEQEEILL